MELVILSCYFYHVPSTIYHLPSTLDTVNRYVAWKTVFVQFWTINYESLYSVPYFGRFLNKYTHLKRKPSGNSRSERPNMRTTKVFSELMVEFLVQLSQQIDALLDVGRIIENFIATSENKLRFHNNLINKVHFLSGAMRDAYFGLFWKSWMNEHKL